MIQYFQQFDVSLPSQKITGRLIAIDILRGLVIVLMALDHTRDFFGATAFSPEDLTKTTPLVFLTRWVTHFCAPIFVFLTGISAFLYGCKYRSRKKLAHFLITRGLWLIVVEIVLINLGWQTGWPTFLFIQVIWVIGISMILLAGMIYLPAIWILIITAVTILSHNLLDGIDKQAWGDFSWLFAILHQRGWLPTGPGRFGIAVIYPLIPWFGVMAAGYLAGPIFLMDAAKRQLLLIRIGGLCCIVFLVLRLWGIYGDPNPWAAQSRGGVFNLFALLNTTKYPASLQFLLMTIGPALLLFPLIERWQGGAAKALAIFGSVPFFFYVLHVPLINLINHFWNWAYYGEFTHFMYSRPPENYSGNFAVVYSIWVLVIVIMFFACRWFSGLKKRHRTWWMSYL